MKQFVKRQLTAQYGRVKRQLLLVPGSSSIPVTEVQTLSFGDNGTMTVASSPTLGITGGSKFTTTTLVTASNAEVNGRPCCHVTAQASCAAAGKQQMHACAMLQVALWHASQDVAWLLPLMKSLLRPAYPMQRMTYI